MNDQEQAALCSDEDMQAVLADMQEPGNGPYKRLDALSAAHPGDPRLHFLQGSLQAARTEYPDAVASMRKAVELAPDFVLARFQLGFLLLTCGEADAALEAWGPLNRLPTNHFLFFFVRGLTHLINDAFDDCIDQLQRGIAENDEIAPLNHDMQLIIDETRRKQLETADGDEIGSSAHQLLQQSALRAIKH